MANFFFHFGSNLQKNLAPFLEIWAKAKNYLRLSHLYGQTIEALGELLTLKKQNFDFH